MNGCFTLVLAGATKYPSPMRFKSLVALVIVALLSPISPTEAATPKAGATCTKAGATSIAVGKKFTCMKSGTKLVWNKGVTVKAAAKPAPMPSLTPEPKVEIKNSLAQDPRITPTSELTSLETCKTEDKTPDSIGQGVMVHRNGFPRPDQSSSDKKSAKVLVIPLIFKDLPFIVEKLQRGQVFSSDIDNLNEVIPRVEDSFKTLSAGRFEIDIDVLPQKEWWVVNIDNPISGVPFTNNFPEIMKVVESQKTLANFDEYDTYVFLTGNGMPGQAGLGSAQASYGERSSKAKSGRFSAVLIAGGFTNSPLWVHELGHSLYGFEDLYLFNQSSAKPVGSDVEVPMKWDLMANSNRGSFLEWNKFLMGWTYDSEVRCLTDQKSSIHYLSTVDSSRDPKLLTINLAPGVTLAAESRISTIDSSGLLLYTINTYISHGEGPILAQKSLIPKGGSKSISGWQISVLESDAEGILIEATKTDIDKFVPPAPRPQQNTPAPSTSTIKITRGEVVPNGFLKGRATWDVTGHESYRVYVTATDDFQKVYFESGFINDSRSQIVVDISGLVCNKELRTVTEFYTKKNGQGEREVRMSTQLSFLSCQDTTKKP